MHGRDHEGQGVGVDHLGNQPGIARVVADHGQLEIAVQDLGGDRKSTRLNSSHVSISYAVFCLKKKTLSHSTKAFPTPNLLHLLDPYFMTAQSALHCHKLPNVCMLLQLCDLVLCKPLRRFSRLH